ncbi:lipopolysaccharide biosynthesis protein [Thermosipho melanesiensis]|uniref:Polysaccharide biosynthesis protein CapD n=2 Tax=Thermosipho melanesiensis TaxID=46541 RepID=A6LMI4_THEM4|nr:polysaccharide biosynthesis protein CapD [Thermosipho melanesiensis BI429]APT74226.1 lipopolysaccharide biosynthesis protein [Thermosipho melanesiensis]OOC36168.1 lipopolysaccharide biosynthesis protein [Thermosipho melanesiensis]OOC36986.1 lipopolysaccharide biosynthesis protein [Thermosipho melanesiensis]OOC37738.1 lipopolysaccharide biosynthesis protein [Thermosipho melanesiensis]
MNRKFLLFLVDIFSTFLAGILSLFVRFGFNFREMSKYDESIYIYILISSIVYIFNGNYKIVWRYANQKDFLKLFRSSIISYFLVLTFFHFANNIVLPRSVGFVMFLSSFTILVGVRLFYQFILENRRNSERRYLIIGSGDVAVSIAEEIIKSGLGDVVGFIGDDASKIGRTIFGKKVLGPLIKLEDYLKLFDYDEVIIAQPNLNSKQINDIIEKVNLKRTKVKVIPSFEELFKEKIGIEDIREISLEDIIGREPVKVSLNDIKECIKDRVVLVTGAGGSIGSEICRQIAFQKPKELLLLGRGENSIYEINEELNEKFPDLKVSRIIADVENYKWMEEIFKRYKPEIVFHTAAHKHVPLMEENPYEAIRVNVFGTINLVKLSCVFNVEKFVFISTDKAVNPTSFMGLSKRISELYVLSKKCSTRFSIVRFGNVIGSRGSVLWKFKKQIENGKPVTITHPEMKRYFMSIPEAVSLVLQSIVLNGNLFVLDMGKQISVEQIAGKLAKLLGKEDIDVVYTGIRGGEKLYEELFYPYEIPKNTEHPKIYSVDFRPNISENEIEYISKEILESLMHFNIEKAEMLAKKIVPEFKFRGGVK